MCYGLAVNLGNRVRLSVCAARSSMRSTNALLWSTLRRRQDCAQQQHSVVEYMAPALAWYAAPAPVVKYMALAPIVGAAPVPVVDDIS